METEKSIRRHFGQIVAGVRDYAVFTLDVAGHVTSWNVGAENIHGYTAEEIIGKHISRFHTAEDNARNWSGEELKIAAGQGRFEEEGWRVRKDGSRFWADVVTTALRDPSGSSRSSRSPNSVRTSFWPCCRTSCAIHSHRSRHRWSSCGCAS